jgi:hypothetical protein
MARSFQACHLTSVCAVHLQRRTSVPRMQPSTFEKQDRCCRIYCRDVLRKAALLAIQKVCLGVRSKDTPGQRARTTGGVAQRRWGWHEGMDKSIAHLEAHGAQCARRQHQTLQLALVLLPRFLLPCNVGPLAFCYGEWLGPSLRLLWKAPRARTPGATRRGWGSADLPQVVPAVVDGGTAGKRWQDLSGWRHADERARRRKPGGV